MNQFEKRLKKTCDIIDTCFALKAAYIKAKNPEYSDNDIRRKIFEEILERKEDQWKSQTY